MNLKLNLKLIIQIGLRKCTRRLRVLEEADASSDVLLRPRVLRDQRPAHRD